MKKLLLKILVLCLVICCMLFVSTACAESPISFTVNFVVDEEIVKTIDTAGNEKISLPENPKKDGFDFDGWFWDKDVWEKPFTANSLLDAPLSSDMSVYAKFTIKHEHNYTAVITSPTCTEKGYTTYTCECGNSYIGDYIDELGHMPETAVEENRQEPKCEVKGDYDLVVYCKTCGAELSREHKDIAALTHEFTNYVSDNNATYEKDGTKTAYCNHGCGTKNVITDLGSKLIAVEKLELNKEELYLVEGENDNIITTISPNNATNKSIVWHSSNSEIAEVNNGIITATGKGTATITASTSNGEVATCQVFVCSNLFTYTVSEGKATITGFNDNMATIVIIPKSYNTFPVTAIRAGVFSNKTMIRTAVIRENITILPNGLFNGCNSLEKVKLPNTITEIEGFAFNGCTSLNEIILPSSLQKIREHAFGNCKNLTKIIIPRSVYYIEKSILYGCDQNLITVTFENTSGWFYHTPQPPYPEVPEKQFQGVVWFLFEYENCEYIYRR